MGDSKQPSGETSVGVSVGALAKRRVRRPTPAARKEQLRQAYAQAAADPAFQAEMAEVDRAFDVTVGDGLDD